MYVSLIFSNEIPELHGGARPEKGPKKVGEGPGTVTGAGRSSLFPFPFHAFVQAAQFLQNSDISHPQHREVSSWQILSLGGLWVLLADEGLINGSFI